MSEHHIQAIPGAESFEIEPLGLGVALRISIALPAKPAVGADSEGNMPVAYITDGDFSFGTAVEACRISQYAGETVPAAVVGIGYAEETGDYAFCSQRRATDFYSGPRRKFEMPGFPAIELGGADLFLSALLDHVFPDVERRAPRIDANQRHLFGTSAGGHFAAYALTRVPKCFAGYAVMSPNLRDFPSAPDEETLVAAVKALPKHALREGVKVFLSAGDREEDPSEGTASTAMISNIFRMRTALAALGATTKLAVFRNENHTSVSGAAFSRAIRFLLGTAG